jgi:hypothetical protein
MGRSWRPKSEEEILKERVSLVPAVQTKCCRNIAVIGLFLPQTFVWSGNRKVGNLVLPISSGSSGAGSCGDKDHRGERDHVSGQHDQRHMPDVTQEAEMARNRAQSEVTNQAATNINDIGAT